MYFCGFSLLTHGRRNWNVSLHSSAHRRLSLCLYFLLLCRVLKHFMVSFQSLPPREIVHFTIRRQLLLFSFSQSVFPLFHLCSNCDRFLFCSETDFFFFFLCWNSREGDWKISSSLLQAVPPAPPGSPFCWVSLSRRRPRLTGSPHKRGECMTVSISCANCVWSFSFHGDRELVKQSDWLEIKNK